MARSRECGGDYQCGWHCDADECGKAYHAAGTERWRCAGCAHDICFTCTPAFTPTALDGCTIRLAAGEYDLRDSAEGLLSLETNGMQLLGEDEVTTRAEDEQRRALGDGQGPRPGRALVCR